jgi:hypothetical protein
LDGKKDKRTKSVTDRLEAARRSRFKIIRTRNIFLMWAISESGSHAHLEPLLEKNDYWACVLCIHSKAGQLSFRLTADDLEIFGHLEMATAAHWEGHTSEENLTRIMRLISSERPLREPVDSGTKRVRKLKVARVSQAHAKHVAVKALGKPLPLGAEVHHVNGDPTDNRPANLVICQDRDYHALLHRKAKEREATK